MSLPTSPSTLPLQSTGNAFNPLVFPTTFNTYYAEPMNLAQRMINVVMDWLMTRYAYQGMQSELEHVRQVFPGLPTTSSYHDYFADRSVLSLVNSNVATHGSWPKYMNTVEVGGIHIKPGLLRSILKVV